MPIDRHEAFTMRGRQSAVPARQPPFSTAERTGGMQQPSQEDFNS